MPAHLSNSSVQKNVEPVCLTLVGTALTVRLSPETIRLVDGTVFHVDGIDREARVLCEIFAHMGALKAGQKKKLANDMLKLLAVEHSLGGKWRKVICVVDEPARGFLCGKSWYAGVIREFGFEVVVPTLEVKLCLGVRQAQTRQADGIRRQRVSKPSAIARWRRERSGQQ